MSVNVRYSFCVFWGSGTGLGTIGRKDNFITRNRVYLGLENSWPLPGGGVCVCVCVCVYVHTCRHSVMSDSFDPMDCRPPGSSAHGIFQARILEWGAISYSSGSSRPRD